MSDSDPYLSDSSSDGERNRSFQTPERWQQDPHARFADARERRRKTNRFVGWMIALSMAALVAIGLTICFVEPPGKIEILANKPNNPIADIPIEPWPPFAIDGNPPKQKDLIQPIKKANDAGNGKSKLRVTRVFTETTTTPIEFVAFHPNSDCFCAGHGATLTMWHDVAKPVVKWSRSVVGRIRCGVFLPDGKQFVVASALGNTGVLRIIDVSDGKVVESLPVKNPRIHNIAASANGRWLAFVEVGKSILHVVPRNDPKQVMTLTEHTGAILAMSFSCDDSLMSYGLDRKLITWDVAGGQASAVVHLKNRFPFTKAHLHCGRQTIFGSDGQRYLVWNWKTKLTEFEHTAKNRGFLFSVAADPSFEYGFVGLRKSGGAYKGAVIDVLDLRTGKIMATLDGHRSIVNSLAASNDGRFLLTSGGIDRTLQLWRLDGR